MKINFFFKRQNLLILFLFLFSSLINQHYGNKGIFPADSFSHFDTGYRILIGEYPFKDYWIISGPLIDYLQSIFFYFFGVNWQVYIFHSSLFNGVLTISTFLVLRNFDLNIYYCFFYSLLFSVLAYPSSGTPFVDHHSAFFSLLAIYALILGIKFEKKIYWVFLPFLLGFAFFSKQVPSSYVIVSILLVLITFLFFKKKYYWIKYFSFSSFVFILLILLFGRIQGISLSSFLDQYIFYPQSIGSERFVNFNFTFNSVVAHFKFIYLSLIPIFYINFKKILTEKNYFKEKDFYYFLILILFSFSLITHQLLTRNQTYIFFLVPILMAFLNIYIIKYEFSFKNLISYILISICFLITLKYHLRFNEDRKFHEMTHVNFELSSNAKEIDEKFKGLKWITPNFKENSKNEIILINEIKSHLKNDNRVKMLLTNYSFFSAILDEKFFSPTRWHIGDGTDYPIKDNKYLPIYRNLLINLINKNKIEVIYSIDPLPNTSIIYNYIDRSCFKEIKISEVLKSYELIKCYEING